MATYDLGAVIRKRAKEGTGKPLSEILGEVMRDLESMEVDIASLEWPMVEDAIREAMRRITMVAGATYDRDVEPEDETWKQFVGRIHHLFTNPEGISPEDEPFFSDDRVLAVSSEDLRLVAYYGSIGQQAWDTNIANGRTLLTTFTSLSPWAIGRISETPWDETREGRRRLAGLDSHEKTDVARALFKLEATTRGLVEPMEIEAELKEEEAVEEAAAEEDSGEMVSEKPYITEREVPAEVVQLVQLDHVPYFSQFIAGKTTDIEVLVEAISRQPRQNILLKGETGTGKTMSLKAVAFLLRYPYLSVNLNGGTTTEGLIGSFIPAEGGGFVWQDGVLTRMVRYGGLFVAEEVNAANPETSFVLFPLLDDKRQIILVDNKGEIINAHPDFVFAATMNPADPEYTGAQRLNKALEDRFNVVLEYEGKNVRKILEEKALIEFYEKIKPMIAIGEIIGTASIRGLRQYLHNKDRHGKDIAKAILLQKFEPGANRDAVEEILITIGV